MAFCKLTIGVAADVTDEYICIKESTIIGSLGKFVMTVVDVLKMSTQDHLIKMT